MDIHYPDPPAASCNFFAAILTFVIIPAIVVSPFVATYIIAKDIGKAIFFPIFGAVLIRVAIGLFILLIAVLRIMCEDIGEPIADWRQAHKATKTPPNA